MRFKGGTFVNIPNKHVLEGLKPAIQCVYFWICSFADKDGVCFPSVKTIAKNAGVSSRGVHDAITVLIDLGVLAKETRKKGKKNLTNVYQIMIVDEGVVHHMQEGTAHGAGGVVHQVQRELNPERIKSSEDNAPAAPTPPPEDKRKLWTDQELLDYMNVMNEDTRRHVRIVAMYLGWKEAGIDNKNGARLIVRCKAQMEATIARYSKVAVRLGKAYTDEEIEEAMEDLSGHATFSWTLETVEKVISDSREERIKKIGKKAWQK